MPTGEKDAATIPQTDLALDRRSILLSSGSLLAFAVTRSETAEAQTPPAPAPAPTDAPASAGKPNIVMIISDDTGYGDLGPLGGGIGRGMPTPNIDKLASEGMTFFSFYAQPSCTPGRAAMITGRIPNRSGMRPWPARSSLSVSRALMTAHSAVVAAPMAASCCSSSW